MATDIPLDEPVSIGDQEPPQPPSTRRSAAAEPQQFREQVRADAQRLYEDVIARLEQQSKDATKKVTLNCPACRKASQVEVSDPKALLAIAEFLVEHGYGRPPAAGDAAGEADRSIVFQNLVILQSEGDEAIDVADTYGLVRDLANCIARMPEGAMHAELHARAASWLGNAASVDGSDTSARARDLLLLEPSWNGRDK